MLILYAMLTNDGMLHTGNPGLILSKWLKIRRTVGTIAKEQKQGMKFKTLSYETVIDRVKDVCDAENVLVYPVSAAGNGHVVEDGTLASVTQTYRCQSVDDGSFIEIAGFGLGADTQDKAGGKAGTYCMKAALAQALMANGSAKKGGMKAPDTDDDDEPIKGGVRAKATKASVSVADVIAAAMAADSEDLYKSVRLLAAKLAPDKQIEVKDAIIAAKTRLGL